MKLWKRQNSRSVPVQKKKVNSSEPSKSMGFWITSVAEVSIRKNRLEILHLPAEVTGPLSAQGNQDFPVSAWRVKNWPGISLNNHQPVARKSDYISPRTSKPTTSGYRLVTVFTVNSWTKICCLMHFRGLETPLPICPETCTSGSPSWLPRAPLESHVGGGKSGWFGKSPLRKHSRKAGFNCAGFALWALKNYTVGKLYQPPHESSLIWLLAGVTIMCQHFKLQEFISTRPSHKRKSWPSCTTQFVQLSGQISIASVQICPHCPGPVYIKFINP